jgi:hypothetical protein
MFSLHPIHYCSTHEPRVQNLGLTHMKMGFVGGVHCASRLSEGYCRESTVLVWIIFYSDLVYT